MFKEILNKLVKALKRSGSESRNTKDYPRGYSDKELGDLIDRYGDLSVDNATFGPAYFSKATLGLIELHSRQNSRIAYLTLSVAAIALIVSIYAMKLTQQQTEYSAIQSIPEQIKQAQIREAAIERCKQSPELNESGLYNTKIGEAAPCSEVLRTFAK